MYEKIILKETPIEDPPLGDDERRRFNDVKRQFINILSEKQFSISQTRYLFRCIFSQFERNMPVTNHEIN